jgi:hypothetical protein
MTDDSILPWYRRALRWGQTNLTEIDPGRYDSAFWRERWRATKLDGVIVNAGGIVAYYPSEYPQHRATGLDGRDFYGDIVKQAREDGLVVIARMDSNRADQALFDQHPDWFTRDVDGKPYRAGPNYISCINSPYYGEFLPAVFREIIERSAPDGFADNSWAGLDASKICYCGYCVAGFAAHSGGAELPRRHDWDDAGYREWVRWNAQRRSEVWRENTRATSAAGGPDCVWVGMISGEQAHETARFIDLHEIAKDASIFFVDHQRRTERGGFAQNADAGKRLHGLVGWDRLLPESMAMYSAGSGFFRATSMPEAEVRVWAASGFAGGIQPWWHHISAQHEDLRQYDTPLPLFAFHERAQRYLVDRTPVAQVAVVWSEQNGYFHGRGDADNVAVNPYRGVVAALSRARIPYLPVHLDDLAELTDDVRVIVLPDTAVMTEEQAEVVRGLVARGVSVLATGEASLKDRDGIRRTDFALADVFGVHASGDWSGSDQPLGASIEQWSRHDYLRLDREPAGPDAAGPDAVGSDAAGPDAVGIVADDIAQIFAGLERTGIVSFGGRLERVRAEGGAVLATYVDPFPFYPPEFAWLPSLPTDVPGLVVRVAESGARIAYLPADLDRIAGRESRPDHLRLLANLVRWQIGPDAVLRVSGAGQLDCNLFAQEGRLILHLVNTAAPSPVPGSLDELVPVGPFEVELRHTSLPVGASVRALVADAPLDPSLASAGRVRFTVPSVADHEILVVG